MGPAGLRVLERLQDEGHEHLGVEQRHVGLHRLHVFEGDLAAARAQPLAHHLGDAAGAHAGVPGVQIEEAPAGPELVQGIVVQGGRRWGRCWR